MKGRRVDIQISGLPGAGKTTIVEIIEAELKKRGFTDISHVCVDDGTKKIDIDKRIESIKDNKIVVSEITLVSFNLGNKDEG